MYVDCDAMQSVRRHILLCGNKMPARCNRGFYCRSYCLLNMFRAPLCPSSGAQEYYTVVAACGISCCGFQAAGHITLSWWAQWCPKHVEQAIRSAIKTSVASSWHFISTYQPVTVQIAVLSVCMNTFTLQPHLHYNHIYYLSFSCLIFKLLYHIFQNLTFRCRNKVTVEALFWILF